MHNTSLPDLEDDKIAIDTLLSLCEAAEKYGNFIALQACRRAILRRAEKTNGEELLKILRFKICRSHLEGIDAVARRTVDIPVRDVWKFCKGYPEVYYFWSRYQIEWFEWESEYADSMNVHSYQTTHKGAGHCLDLEKWLDCLHSYKRRPDGTYSTWDDFETARAFMGKMPDVKTFCGCGGFNQWRVRIKKTFEKQPRWEDFTG
ncbi:hypothetical protein PM082_024637 [Marasmius tenuissimus]|nr:hypothetical protein PM082_024637 [Marasmius tenuissimus]